MKKARGGRTSVRQRDARRYVRGRAAGAAIILAGLVGSALVLTGSTYWRDRNQTTVRQQFQATASGTSDDVTNTLLRYGDLLSGSAALFHQGLVTRTQYDEYLDAEGFRSSRFPGLLGAGFVQVVSAAQVPSFIAGLRSDGVANASVTPAGQRARYCLGSYADWINLRVTLPLYGYDFCTVPALFKPLVDAATTGTQHVLAGASLGAAYRSDFVLVQPVYSGSPAGPTERQQDVIGWVLAIVNGPGVLKSIQGGPGMQFIVTAGTARMPGATPVLRSPPTAALSGVWGLTMTEEAYGPWTTRFRVGPHEALPGANVAGPIAFLVAGLLAVALLVAMLGTLAFSRRRAVREVARATHTLRASEERFRKLVANSSDLIVMLDEKGDLRYANPAGERILGFVPSKELGHNMLSLIHPEDLPAATEAFERDAYLPGVHPPARYRFRTGQGTWRTLEVTATNCLSEPAVEAIVINARDVTAHARMERAQRTLSAAILAVVHADDESALLQDVCQLLVDVGSYRLAWVGAVRDDEARTIEPVCVAGLDVAETFPVSWDDTPAGQGPGATAVRTGVTQVVNDMRRASFFSQVGSAAEAYGLRSCCALPLEVAGRVIGVLGMYASEPDEFDPPEVALMEELASELSFGLGRIRDALALDASEERFRTLADAAPIGILESPTGGGVVYANPRMAEICERKVEELMGTGWQQVVHPDDRDGLVAFIDAARPQRRRITTSFRIVRPGGEIRHVRMSSAPKGRKADEGYVTTIEDITDEVVSHDELAHRAFHDTLTGLPNRALFLNRLNQELARHRRVRSKIAVLFLDLDRFKIVNDSLGHETGDAVLREVGDRFMHAVRADETAARFSGDEFMFILRDIADAQAAETAAKRLLDLLSVPMRCGGHVLTVTGSIGIVTPSDGSDAATVLRDADTAMYKAKEAGRNTFAMFDEELHFRSVARLTTEAELRQALALGEFEVFYQPIVSPTTDRPVGAEALVRWRHPTRGIISPLDFIPVAEDTGLIIPIGRFVFDQAVAQLATWDAIDDGLHLDLLSVNLSALQLDDPATAAMVSTVLQVYGVSPDRVAVEVTEYAAMSESEATRRTLQEFHDLGLRVAIDDFGTGYSSLAYLHTLPVTTLKIDRLFTERLGGADDSTPVVRAIVEMAHALDLRVVAEGVSSVRLRDLVSGLGCDVAQGFYWTEPLPAALFEIWWHEALHRAAAVTG